MLEKPLVRAVSDPVDGLIFRASQVGPAFGDDGAYFGLMNCADDGFNHPARIIKNNAAKPYVYRGGTIGEEVG